MADQVVIPEGWEEVKFEEQGPSLEQLGAPPPGWEEVDPQKVAGYKKYAEALSKTPPLGLGEHAAAMKIPIEDRELVKKFVKEQYTADQTMQEVGYGARLGTSAAKGFFGAFEGLAKAVNPSIRLNPGQERFKQELLGIREGIDPTIRPDTPTVGRWTQQAAQMTAGMIPAIGAGRAAGTTATALGGGKAAVSVATGVGTSGSFLPQTADQTYTSLIAEGVPPDRAAKITAISAPIEAALESILPDPLSPYASVAKGTVRQVAGRILSQATKNYTKELAEEGLQGIVNETALEVGRQLDASIPNQGLGNILMRGVEDMAEAAGPLAVMMGPGTAIGAAQTAQESAARKARLEYLTEIRSKGYVSAEEGQAAGIAGETRKQRLANTDAEITQLQKEIQDATEVREAEVPGEEQGQVQPEPEAKVPEEVEVLEITPGAKVVFKGFEPDSDSPMTPVPVEEIVDGKAVIQGRKYPLSDLAVVQPAPEAEAETKPVPEVPKKISYRKQPSPPPTTQTPKTEIIPDSQAPTVSSGTPNQTLQDAPGSIQTGQADQGVESADEQAAPQSKEFGKDVGPVLGAASAIPLTGGRGGIGNTAKQLTQRFFASRGELPVEAYEADARRKGRIAKEMTKLRFAAKDFQRGIKKALGGKQLTQADVETMNAVLGGEADPSTVPENLHAPIQAMRDHIDALARQLIHEGVAQGDLVGIIEEHEGVYMTRSYRVFDDPKWRDKVPAEVRNRAVAAIREQSPEKSDAEVAGILESLLFRGAADSPVALLKGSKLGSKDLSVFMKRKDIPPWLRDLWGEYKDAGVNYARSIFKMSHLLANQQFLNEVKEAGTGKWLRTQEEGPIVNEHGEVITKIAADASSVMEPLNGMYTTPEIKAAFERFDSPGAMPEWLRVLMSVNYAVKYGKTVGSMMTQVRNMVGNVGFAVGNGHWRLDKAGKAIWATATGTFQLPSKEFRAYYGRLAELGIVGEDVRAGELKDALRDASEANIDEFLYSTEARHAKKIVNAGRSGVRFLNSLYQAGDAVWKIYAFENEKARYSNVNPEWSEDQVEKRAAEIVRNTYPTYSKIPAAIKALRRFPLVGTFVSFPSEVVRTTFHTLKLGMEEMQSQETRSIGAQRLAGTAAALGGLSLLSRAMMGMFGIGDDEDDDLRWFVPPWQENSRFIYTEKPKDAQYHFIDLGYSDPHAYLTDAAVAFMRGDDWKDSLTKSLGEFLRPFASEDILAKALMDVRDNDDHKVYNPKDEAGEQAKDIVTYLWTKALEPGTVTSLRRIQTAASGTDPSKSVSTEVTTMLTGQRLQNVDVEHSLGFRVRDFSKALTDIEGIARKTATSRGTATGEMVATDVARMEKLRLAEFAEMQEIVGAARRLGVPEKNIRTLLRHELSDKVAGQLMTGNYAPYKMTREMAKRIRDARPEEFDERLKGWDAGTKRASD